MVTINLGEVEEFHQVKQMRAVLFEACWSEALEANEAAGGRGIAMTALSHSALGSTKQCNFIFQNRRHILHVTRSS